MSGYSMRLLQSYLLREDSFYWFYFQSKKNPLQAHIVISTVREKSPRQEPFSQEISPHFVRRNDRFFFGRFLSRTSFERTSQGKEKSIITFGYLIFQFIVHYQNLSCLFLHHKLNRNGRLDLFREILNE